MRICADESERTKAKITKQDWNQNNRLSNKIEIRIKTNLYLLYKLGCPGTVELELNLFGDITLETAIRDSDGS